MRRPALLLLLAACGRLDFDPLGDGGGGGGGGGGAVCGPWSAPQPITELETPAQDWGGQITGDGLTLYFNSDRGPSGHQEIYSAQRPDRGSPFGSAALVPGLGVGSTANEDNPTVTRDQLEMFFESDAGAGYVLYTSTRTSTADDWTAPTRLDALYDGTTDDVGSYVTPDGLTLVYMLGVPTGALAATTRLNRMDPFAAGTQLAGTAGSAYADPALSADGLTLLVEIDGSTDLDQTDLYEAARPTTDARFGAPTLLSVSEPGSRESDPSLTADNTELFFASDRAGGVGEADLYTATRSCE